jgi:hypothetical protein
MDRMADTLTPAAGKPPIRKFLLHTCNAGNSAAFMQKIANRLRVRVQAHTNFIVYTGNVKGSIQAHYDGETPADPVSKEDWPTGQVGKEYYPSPKPPPRYTP